MTKLLRKITSWLKPRLSKSRRICRPHRPKLAKTPPFNEKHYRKLIGRLTKKTIAYQRNKEKEETHE